MAVFKQYINGKAVAPHAATHSTSAYAPLPSHCRASRSNES